MGHRMRKDTLMLHVKWWGFPVEEASWIPLENAENGLMAVIRYFSSRTVRGRASAWRRLVEPLLDQSDEELMALWRRTSRQSTTEGLMGTLSGTSAETPLLSPPSLPPSRQESDRPPSPCRRELFRARSPPRQESPSKRPVLPESPKKRPPLSGDDRPDGRPSPRKSPRKELRPPPSTLSAGWSGAASDPVADALAAPPCPPPVHHVFEVVPGVDEAWRLLERAVKQARKVPSLAVCNWKPGLRRVWEEHMRLLADVLWGALSNPTPEALFGAVFAFMAAPGEVIGALVGERKECFFDSADSTVNAALAKLAVGQERKAFKLLCSNGVAKMSDEVKAALAKLHPARDVDLKLPALSAPQVWLSAERIAERLFAEAAETNIAKDVFGWSPSLLFDCRGVEGGLLTALSHFLSFLAESPSSFPLAAASLIAAGKMTPLNKDGAIERKLRDESGCEPRLRPINSGTMVSKMVLMEVLDSVPAKRAAEKVKPAQLSLGSSRACERAIHSARAAHEAGWLVAKHDFTNGFNTVKRQVLLDEHDRCCPESTAVFNFVYGIDAPILLFGEDGEVSFIESQEGARQGCPAGTESFCFAIDGAVKKLEAEFPDFIFKVVTDDVMTLVPCRVGSEQLAMRAYAGCRRRLEEEAALIGLALNARKCALLLPEGCPLPDEGTRAMFPAEQQFPTDGFIVTGAPVGKDSFVAGVVRQKCEEAKLKLKAAQSMGAKDARAAQRLISSCFTKMLNFVATTVPPQITQSMLRELDDAVYEAFIGIVSTGEPVRMEGARGERAKAKARLPAPHGCGLFSVADFGAVAWIASVLNCVAMDDDVRRLSAGLGRHVGPAWRMLAATLGGESSSYWQRASCHLPSSPEGLLTAPQGAVYRNLGKILLKVIRRKRIDDFVELTARANIDYTFLPADFVLANSRTLTGSIFIEPIKPQRRRLLTQENYAHFVRFFLGLPPLTTVGGHCERTDHGYPVQLCPLHPGEVLDAAATHASACTGANSAKNRKHLNLCLILSDFAKEAGLEAAREPQSHALLLGVVDEAQCKRLFPTKAVEGYAEAFNELLYAQRMMLEPNCRIPMEERAAVLKELRGKLPICDDRDVTGLRVDLAISDPATGEAKWVDVTSVNTASSGCVQREVSHLVKYREQMSFALEASLPRLPGDGSPALAEREREKVAKYSRLMLLAELHYRQRLRPNVPAFVPFAVSTTGDISPGGAGLMSWLCAKHRDLCERDGPRADGLSVKELVLSYRRRLSMAVQFAVAAGMGEIMRTVGVGAKVNGF